MRYMIAPLDLNTEELEIYKLLYSKMDFDTFKVKYTVEQLANDSNSKLKITKKSASLIIKKFINDNLLSVYKKGSKGNPTIYIVTKLNELEKHKSNLTETQKELNRNLKETNNISIFNNCSDFEKHKGNLKETQKEVKGNANVNPIKDKDKDKDNIYKLVEEAWNNIGISKLRKLTPKRKSSINARLKDYDEETIFKVLDNISNSDFLKGKNKRNWKCEFDWAFNPNNFAKILEGNYNKQVVEKENNDKEIKEVDRETAFVANSAEDVIARIKMLQEK